MPRCSASGSGQRTARLRPGGSFRQTGVRMNTLRFAGPFAFLAAIPALYHLLHIGPLLVPPVLLLVLLALNAVRMRVAAEPAASAHLLPMLYIPLQLAVIAWATLLAPQVDASAFLALAI